MIEELRNIPASQLIQQLPFSGAVVEDGNWVSRFLPGLLSRDDSTAINTLTAALQDDELIDSASVLLSLQGDGVLPSVRAFALRKVWLAAGINAEAQDIFHLFSDARNSAASYLMRPEDLERLSLLPDLVTVFRGQMYKAGGLRADGISFSLNEELADYYAAPIESLGQPHGWVLKMKIPKRFIMAYFDDRNEQEVVVSPLFLRVAVHSGFKVSSRRGTTDVFPGHLSLPDYV